jgi:hypothetical protein
MHIHGQFFKVLAQSTRRLAPYSWRHLRLEAPKSAAACRCNSTRQSHSPRHWARAGDWSTHATRFIRGTGAVSRPFRMPSLKGHVVIDLEAVATPRPGLWRPARYRRTSCYVR